MTKAEFEEIAHTGGIVTLSFGTRNDGRRAYQVTYTHCRPVRVALIEICAHYDGDRVARLDFNEAPPPGWFLTHLASDSEGRFGHQCPRCNRYWRSGPYPTTCPYCRFQSEGLDFLTEAQKSYVQKYCERLRAALEAEEDGEYVIDMDLVAEAAGKDGEKPPFYYAEESQQNKFDCCHCGEFNDIFGRFGYCSACATRNDLHELEDKTIPRIRARINAGGPYEDCVKDAVAAFDSFTDQYVRQLVKLVPMTKARVVRFENMVFQNLDVVRNEIKTAFDIDIRNGISASDFSFATRMFFRRHVYEHKGGEADERYIQDSGDANVRPKQALHETQESAHRLVGLVVKSARNLDKGFHEIFPKKLGRIEAHAKRRALSDR